MDLGFHGICVPRDEARFARVGIHPPQPPTVRCGFGVNLKFRNVSPPSEQFLPSWRATWRRGRFVSLDFVFAGRTNTKARRAGYIDLALRTNCAPKFG